MVLSRYVDRYCIFPKADQRTLSSARLRRLSQRLNLKKRPRQKRRDRESLKLKRVNLPWPWDRVVSLLHRAQVRVELEMLRIWDGRAGFSRRLTLTMICICSWQRWYNCDGRGTGVLRIRYHPRQSCEWPSQSQLFRNSRRETIQRIDILQTWVT